MKDIAKKLREKAGETLTETLAAVLIIGIVSGGFAALIRVASNLNQTASSLLDELNSQVSNIEVQGSECETPEGTICFIVGTETESEIEIGSGIETIDVTYYIQDGGNLYSYE